MQAHALDNLQFIRETMERAGSFTAVSGWGQIIVGLIALVAAVVASGSATPEAGVRIWLAAAVASVAVAACGMALKARATHTPLFSGPGRKFVSSFSPPLVAGALLSLAVLRLGAFEWLPGIWLLLFGTAVMTGGAFSVRVVPIMGICFMAIGAVALLGPASLGNVLMAIGFGGLHLVFGVIIAVKYGG
ncbi:MAG: hypothetical protein IMZ44_22090 [Planctomycetes bacterium]|nr:hypothetical protein [Planctomycetota bacterium]